MVRAMALADQLARSRSPASTAIATSIRQAWNVLSGCRAARSVFSRLVGRMAPYTGSIDARSTVLRAGYAEVVMADRRAVRNHLDCVHAIALANLAELAGNVALVYSLPDDARFIVSGMEIEYMKKARGTITADRGVPGPADRGPGRSTTSRCHAARRVGRARSPVRSCTASSAPSRVGTDRAANVN